MIKNNFNKSSVDSQAKEIAQKIFNENARLDDTQINSFAQ